MAHARRISPQGLAGLEEILPKHDEAAKFLRYLQSLDIEAAVTVLGDESVEPELVQRLHYISNVFWSVSESISDAKIILEDKSYDSVKDIARNLDSAAASISSDLRPTFEQHVYYLEATRCIANALAAGAFNGDAPSEVQTAACKILDSLPDFDIERESVLTTIGYVVGTPDSGTQDPDGAACELLKLL